MCGIVGLILPAGRKTLPDVIRALRDLVIHRGPDDRGFASVDSATGTISSGIDGTNSSTLRGFTRPGIRDNSHRGHQPMISDDGSVVILFNGEVYNTDELTEKYLPRQKLNSTCDTELLLRLYQAIGMEKLVPAIDGMFAIVIYDSRKAIGGRCT